MSEKQQTAVEWFHEQLLKGEFINDPNELLRQANELFEKQVNDAYCDGRLSVINKEIISMNDYYSKTYSK